MCNNELIPPYNADAEMALLGSILVLPDEMSEVAKIVKPEDFFTRRAQWIFSLMLEMHQAGEAIDPLTVMDRAERLKANPSQLRPYVTQLLAAVHNARHAEAYARIVRGTAVRRRFIMLCQELVKMALDDTRPVKEILKSAAEKMRDFLRNP